MLGHKDDFDPEVRETVEPSRSETQSVITRRGRRGLRTDAAPPEESGTVSADIRQDAGAQRRLRPRVRETVEPPRSETQSVITRRGRRGLRTDAAPPEESGTVSADIRQDAGAQRRLRPRVRDTVEPSRSETQSVITRRGRRGLRTDAAPPD
uniref:Ribonuclease E/G n=1 Tax=Haemonchus contortus TaxID=6289 RepID=A0A7I4Z5J1_HAECO